MRNAAPTDDLTDRLFRSLASALLFAAVLLVLAGEARGQIEVDINRGFFEPLPVAVTDFHGELQDEAKTGADIGGVIAANLERSGLFRPLPPKAFIPNSSTERIFARYSLLSGKS